MKITIIEDRKEIADSIGRAIDRQPDLTLAGVYYAAEDALELGTYFTGTTLPGKVRSYQ